MEAKGEVDGLEAETVSGCLLQVSLKDLEGQQCYHHRHLDHLRSRVRDRFLHPVEQ